MSTWKGRISVVLDMGTFSLSLDWLTIGGTTACR
jgi:hypothetical protein